MPALPRTRPAPRPRRDGAGQPLSALDRARYQTRHRALAVASGVYIGMWQRLLMSPPRPQAAAVADLRASFDALLRADLANVEAGHYPRELLFDLPYRRYVSAMPELLLEQVRIGRRALGGRYDELPAAARPHTYPRYYRRTFHWQSDGWLSERSARLYDPLVGLLFGGATDIMRRMALPPLLAGLGPSSHARGAAPHVLDIGCGTGRFLATLARCLPAARLWGVDLSPYYVAHARRELADQPGVALAVQNAESMSFADSSFDAATMVFLLHELPKDVRRRVVREALRVLRPGARLVLCDAAQHRDSGSRRYFLDQFPSTYHEPYFKSYLRDELESLVTECGFEVESSQVHFLVKVVSARRPSTQV
ncbi:class I SAM-dependent methyltransferase [Haliangium sp.]|uniref:class I SAM-dependent methyltransferase n=1 Tax=Haliangium sp. TaxID=2663208 RepID=UPI003D10DA37